MDVMGERQIQVTATQSMKGAAITGGCAFLGGLLAGPIGLAIGGASGGALAAYQTKGSFKSIGQILNDLPDDRKEEIALEIRSIIDKLDVTDLSELVKLAAIAQQLTQPDRIVIDQFISHSLPVLQRHLSYR